MRERKGLSTVVATVLIIFLTVAAIGILAGFVVPFAREQLAGTECAKYKDYFKFEESTEYICSYGDSYGISIQSTSDKKLGEKILGFNLQLIGEESRIVNARIDQMANNELFMLDGSSTLNIPKNGDVDTFVLKDVKTYEQVKIIPVIKGESGKEISCDISDTISFKPCNGVVLP